MRSDFILPAFLAVALAVLIGYAASGDGSVATAIVGTPVHCDRGASISTIGELREASGLATSGRTPQLFWSHNDSAEPVVFGIGSDGNVRARVRIAGASVKDWEAITTAPCADDHCLFVGDIGDNDRSRPYITVYRVNEPAPDEQVSSEVTSIDAVYPEGPQDAEAMFVVDATLYVLTKGDGAPIRLYRFPTLEPDTRHTLQLVATLTQGPADRNFRVTDAAPSPDKRWIAVRSNDAILFYEANALLAGRPARPLSFDVRALHEPQGEGIAWSDGRTLFLAGEGGSGGTFAHLTCSDLAPSTN